MHKKRLFFALALLLSSVAVSAQNLQVHYDFGRQIYSDEEATRQQVTLTFEQFKADKLGSWYWFIDLDMYHDGMKGAYTEISREFTFAQPAQNLSLAGHIEYDGGMTTFKNGGGTRFQNAALIGAALNGHNSDFSTTWSIQAMYKQYFKYQSSRAYASMQLTGVWGVNFADGKGTFSGFLDIWRGEKANGHGQLVMLSEPQLWYNASKHFSLGTEIEFSNNFIVADCPTSKQFYVNPTLAVKFIF